MAQKVFIDYKVGGTATNAFSVELGSEDSTFGLKRQDTGEVILSDGTSVSNPSTGRYEFTFDPILGVIYFVSWRVIPSNGASDIYVTETLGPFTDTTSIQASLDQRGTFIQGLTSTLKLNLTDFEGNALEANNLSVSIRDANGTEVDSGTPEKIVKGFYIYDWTIPSDQAIGQYSALWSYTIDGNELQTTQIFQVIEDSDNAEGNSLYGERISQMRAALEIHLRCAQNIPVYDEEGLIQLDERTVKFNFPRWNQKDGTRIYLNQKRVDNGVIIDYFRGEVIFDKPIKPKMDTVTATYNFRWFDDEDLDRFMSNALHIVNTYPPASNNTNLFTIEDRFIPHILYGATKDAIRQLLLCLQFQEPKEVFGGPDAAEKAFQQMETLKKNYEEDFRALLEQKKFGPYKGLTKTVVTPEYTLPGGRSRWFRYLFKGGS